MTPVVILFFFVTEDILYPSGGQNVSLGKEKNSNMTVEIVGGFPYFGQMYYRMQVTRLVNCLMVHCYFGDGIESFMPFMVSSGGTVLVETDDLISLDLVFDGLPFYGVCSITAIKYYSGVAKGISGLTPHWLRGNSFSCRKVESVIFSYFSILHEIAFQLHKIHTKTSHQNSCLRHWSNIIIII